MRIPEDKIEDVRALSDIVEVVSEYVSLRARGANYIGLCPFHNEKTPSFNVNPERSIFKCFGCGKGGDVFTFIREMENVSYPESIRLLAARVGVEIPEEQRHVEADNELESVHNALRFAARFYHETLIDASGGESKGLTYYRKRAFEERTIRKFGLGYAAPGWDNLIKHAEEQSVKVTFLERAGLVSRRENRDGLYDRFRDRAIFPLFSHVGKVVGFAGRLIEDRDDSPKYVNSPETEVYHKGRVVYGLFQGKNAIRKTSEVFLVEGYTDVISLWQAGVENAVATSGTALTPDQVKLIGRYAKTIVLLFDADSAGQAAARRAIDLVLSEGLSVYVVSLPDGADPDSYVRQFGGESFLKYARKYRTDFVRHILSSAASTGQLDVPEKKLAVIRDVLGSISRIEHAILQGEYVQALAQELRVPDAELRSELKQILKKKRRSNHPRRAGAVRELNSRQGGGADGNTTDLPKERLTALPEELLLLKIMLEEGGSMIQLIMGHMSTEEFTAGDSRELVVALLEMYRHGRINQDAITGGHMGDRLQALATDLLTDRHELSKNWGRKTGIVAPGRLDDPEAVAMSAIALMKRDRITALIKSAQQDIYNAQQDGEDPTPLLEKMGVLQRQRRELETGSWIERNGS